MRLGESGTRTPASRPPSTASHLALIGVLLLARLFAWFVLAQARGCEGAARRTSERMARRRRGDDVYSCYLGGRNSPRRPGCSPRSASARAVGDGAAIAYLHGKVAKVNVLSAWGSRWQRCATEAASGASSRAAAGPRIRPVRGDVLKVEWRDLSTQPASTFTCISGLLRTHAVPVALLEGEGGGQAGHESGLPRCATRCRSRTTWRRWWALDIPCGVSRRRRSRPRRSRLASRSPCPAKAGAVAQGARVAPRRDCARPGLGPRLAVSIHGRGPPPRPPPGEVLVFEHAPIEAYFHSTCGGTDRARRRRPGPRLPGPGASVTCGRCQASPRWSLEGCGRLRPSWAGLTASGVRRTRRASSPALGLGWARRVEARGDGRKGGNDRRRGASATAGLPAAAVARLRRALRPRRCPLRLVAGRVTAPGSCQWGRRRRGAARERATAPSWRATIPGTEIVRMY